MADYPLMRAFKPAVGWSAVFVCMVSAAAMLFPELLLVIVFLSPVYISLCGIKGGLVPLAFLGLGTVAAVWLTFQNLFLTGISALYLLPFLALNVFCFSKKIPFWRSAAFHIGLNVVCQTVVIMLLRQKAGGDLFGGGAAFLTNALGNSPYGDSVLIQLYQFGLLSVPKEMLTGWRPLLESLMASFAASPLLPSVRTELINGLRTLLEMELYSFIPSTLVTGSILTGVLGVALPVALARRDGISTVDMPPLSAWHLSRSVGWKVGLLGLGNLMPYLIPNVGMVLAGNMMWAACITLFMIQGAAFFDFIQKRQNVGRFFRRLWISLIYLLLPTLFLILGVMDQIVNIRGLRNRPDREEF